MEKIIAIVGPTASGKTSLGIALAHQFNGEIISADSRQIYRGMDIGTAKPPRDPGQRKGRDDDSETDGAFFSEGIRHHLIDIRDPNDEYTVAEFKRDADAAIHEIAARGKLPILVGGTGLYVRAVVENLEIPAVKPDPALRRSIEDEIAEKGLPSVFEKLIALDPEAAYVVDPRNPRRVVRALEVAAITGKPFTAQRRTGAPTYHTLELGLNPPIEILRKRIDQRIDDMICDGLVDEVKKLYRGEQLAAFDAIGYREIIDYLDGSATLEESTTAMKFNTWHFAKRQMAWFKKGNTVHWLHGPEYLDEASALVEPFLAAL